MTLAAYSMSRRLGRITLAGGRLTGTSPGLQDVADAAVRQAGGDAAAAYAALDGYCNGYLTIITAPAEQAAEQAGVAAGWRSFLHPRVEKGEHGGGQFTRDGGGAPPPSSPSRLSRLRGRAGSPSTTTAPPSTRPPTSPARTWPTRRFAPRRSRRSSTASPSSTSPCPASPGTWRSGSATPSASRALRPSP